MGIATILESRSIVLLVKAVAKAQALKDAVEGQISADCPAHRLLSGLYWKSYKASYHLLLPRQNAR